ncbi:hypothetical protein CROQUDRAFT_660650 [Cronartium quercuum f. sp. fusiforme G11]|uniref:GRIP domain-containing protein n=1 Tax=Cronartium quercuum f. sp. fusiforme G11 TaxID=708437 RepID=A0A9P6NC28_9BASI|nr:hypothetical protein CROQUDRAFT_660650 [Cronartium quercuum f. sp. fusiforme G11]
MAANIALPPSPILSPNPEDLPLLRLQDLPSLSAKAPSSPSSRLPEVALQSRLVSDSLLQTPSKLIDEFVAALFPALSGDENFEELRSLLQNISNDTRLKTSNISKLLNLLTARKQQSSSTDFARRDQFGSQTPPQPVAIDTDREIVNAPAAEVEQLKAEITQLQSKVKLEEEKRTKSISLLRAVRQKLVQTEKDKSAIEMELDGLNKETSNKAAEFQNEKARLEEELSRTRIAQQQQLSKMRHSFERETQHMRSQFERDAATKKSQSELDAITAKAAYERELTMRNSKISQLDARVRELSLERDRLFDQLQSKHAEIESTTARHDEIQGRAGELQHQLNDSRDHLAALLEEVDNLRQLSSSQVNGEDGYRKLLAEVQSQHASQTALLSARISQLEKERTDLEHDLGQTLKARLKDIEQMRHEAHVKSLEYADSLQNMAERNEQILASNAKIKTLQDQLALAEQARSTQTVSVTNLSNELQELKTLTSAQASQIATLENALKEAQDREGIIRSQAHSLRDELRKVQSGVLSNEHQRSRGVGFFANFSTSTTDATPRIDLPDDQVSTSRISLKTTHDLALDNSLPVPDQEAELNFEYLRNTLLQFLEHKEMRPHLVRVLGVILHFTPQETRRLAAKVAS